MYKIAWLCLFECTKCRKFLWFCTVSTLYTLHNRIKNDLASRGLLMEHEFTFYYRFIKRIAAKNSLYPKLGGVVIIYMRFYFGCEIKILRDNPDSNLVVQYSVTLQNIF